MAIKDSGKRKEFKTGAVRDVQDGKGRCDLLPLDVVGWILEDSILTAIERFKKSGEIKELEEVILTFSKEIFNPVVKENEWYFYDTAEHIADTMLKVSKHFEEGAIKYGENNWQKGIPIHCYIDSAVRHYFKWLRDDKDEPHDIAFIWNILCCYWTVVHKPELIDL